MQKCKVNGCDNVTSFRYCMRCEDEITALQQMPKESLVKRFAISAALVTLGMTICMGVLWLIVRTGGGKP